MHTQNRPISKKFLIPFTCLNREAKKWGYFEKKFKSPFTCLKWETILGGVFLQIFLKISFENKKSPPDSLNREEKVNEMLLNCYMKESSISFLYPYRKKVFIRAALRPDNT